MNVILLVRLGADPLFWQSMLDEPEKKLVEKIDVGT